MDHGCGSPILSSRSSSQCPHARQSTWCWFCTNDSCLSTQLNLPPSSSHGSLVSLPGIFINCGILFGCIISFCLSGLAAHLSWCLMLGAGAVPAICLSLAVLLIMPECLCWLVIQNRIQEAEQVLLKTSHDKAEANDHLVEIMEAAGLMGSKLDDRTWVGW
jgi:hypothetical protein